MRWFCLVSTSAARAGMICILTPPCAPPLPALHRGFTVYANPEAAAAGAPPAAGASAGAAAMVVSGRSSGRAPLQLTRSGVWVSASHGS